MSRLLRSGLRFGWALSMSGAEGLARVLGGEPMVGEDGVARDLERRWREAPEDGAPSSDERPSIGSWPSIESWLAPGRSREEWLGVERRLVDGAHELAATARVLLPSKTGRLAARASESQLAAYGHFRRAATLAPEAPLAERIESASTVGDPEALWLYEGLGYDHAERHLAADARNGTDPHPGAAPRALPADLPTAALATLHTGVGLSLARRRLDRSDELELEDRATGPGEAAAELLRRTLDDGADLAAPGCGGIFVETLGFAVRLLRPACLPALDRALDHALVDPEGRFPGHTRSLFWHGVGRATCFAPHHLVPGLASLHGAVDRLRAEVRQVAVEPGTVLDDALAGLAWAVGLVQVPAPEVLASALHAWSRQGGGLDDRERRAIVDGLVSMGLLWWQGSGGLGGSSPSAAHRDFFRPRDPLWTEWVSEPMARALARAQDGPGSIPPDSLYRFADRGAPA
jgi:hypothetical protein